MLPNFKDCTSITAKFIQKIRETSEKSMKNYYYNVSQLYQIIINVEPLAHLISQAKSKIFKEAFQVFNSSLIKDTITSISLYFLL